MLGTELDGLGLAVVAIVDFDNTATGFIDDDAVWSAIVLIEIADNAYEQQESENDAAACEVFDGANILRVAIDGRKSRRFTLRGGTSRNGPHARVVVLDLSFVQHNEFSLESMDYVISDEDGERSWIWQPVWSEFGKKLSYKVVSDGKVLFAGDDDYLFLVIARGVEIVAEPKDAHRPADRASCVPITIDNTDIERHLVAAASGVRD